MSKRSRPPSMVFDLVAIFCLLGAALSLIFMA